MYTSAPPQPGTQRWRSAFTLIEVLVVVAIIALLASILMPSLSRVRVQAKITIDRANMKQIGTAMAGYMAENRNRVPIMYNYWAITGSPYNMPARATMLSVALRNQTPDLRNLKQRDNGRFNPEASWTWPIVDEYEDRVMPPFYMCPFERAHGNGVTYVSQDSKFYYWEWRGRFESYHIWLWEDIVRGRNPLGKPWPIPGTLDGIAKHSVLTWHQGRAHSELIMDQNKKYLHREWKPADAQKAKSPSLSDVTVVYCSQGEHMQWAPGGNLHGRFNVGSHRTSQGGGTLAIFGDTHVEWVLGTRIGWP